MFWSEKDSDGITTTKLNKCWIGRVVHSSGTQEAEAGWPIRRQPELQL